MRAKEENLPTYAQQLRELRTRLGIKNQTDFAAALGTDQGTVSKWMNGRSRPLPEAFTRMALLAQGAQKLYFLEEAGIPAEFFQGRPMLGELAQASSAIVSKSITGVTEHKRRARENTPGAQDSWDRDLMIFAIETVTEELAKHKRKLPARKYAEMVVLFYDLCHQTGRRDSGMVGRLLMIA